MVRVLVLGSNVEGYAEALECARCVNEAGGVAELVMLETVTGEDGAVLHDAGGMCVLKDAFERCDGLCLTGGSDIGFPVNPTPGAGAGPPYPRRDRFEHDVVRQWLAAGKRVLGICRGTQLLALESGGELIPHLEGHMGHNTATRDKFIDHPIVTSRRSIAQRVAGRISLVNSSHHQAISDAGSLKVTAYRRHEVEAVESENVLGVQWHPEMLASAHPGRLAPFRWLVVGA